MGNMELPLVIFTILSQMSVGGLLYLWLLDRALPDAGPVIPGRRVAWWLVGCLGAGLVASLFHLGHPLNAYRALTHLSTSWLSREILLFSLFFLLLVVYASQWRDGGNRASRLGVGGIAAVVGVLGVAASAMIYAMPSRPAWNNLGPVLFFLLTTGLLGGLMMALFLHTAAKRGSLADPAQDRWYRWLRQGIWGTLVASLLLTILYLSMLSSGSPEARATAQNLLGSPVFWLRAAVGWLAPVALLGHWASRKNGRLPGTALITGLFLLVLAGEILGRVLFYAATVGMQVAGF